MANDYNVRRYNIEEIRALRGRGEDRSDWNRLDSMTEAEQESSISSDPDWKGIPEDWYKNAVPVTPPPQLLSLRLDANIIAWFRAQGPGYQTRMNAVLRTYMTAITRR